MELPAASEIHGALRATLDPVVTPMGYKRQKGAPPEWAEATSDGPKTVFWAQVHPKAKDPYSGGEFLFEFERMIGNRTAGKLSGRARLDQLLIQSELQRLLDHQNRVIASLPRPPASHVAQYPESLRDAYRKEFEPQTTFRPGDLWLRYRTLDDVRAWLAVISDLLPVVLSRAARLDPGVMYLGGTINLDANPLQRTHPLPMKGQPQP